jgi:hypothetical protein
MKLPEVILLVMAGTVAGVGGGFMLGQKVEPPKIVFTETDKTNFRSLQAQYWQTRDQINNLAPGLLAQLDRIQQQTAFQAQKFIQACPQFDLNTMTCPPKTVQKPQSQIQSPKSAQVR